MATKQDYINYAVQQARAAGIDENIYYRQINLESGFNPGLVSPAGAIGIAQFKPRTAAGLGINPWDPWQSLQAAAKLMRSYLSQFGSYALALAAYNAGPEAVTKYGGVPPYAETQKYVRLILGSSASPGVSDAGSTSPMAAGGGAVLVLMAALVLALLVID